MTCQSLTIYADGCPVDDTEIVFSSVNGTEIGRIPLQWPESSISGDNIISLPCPCGTVPAAETLSLFATRSCRGDFMKQAEWETPDFSDCEQLNFDLCAISEVSHRYDKMDV